MATGPKSPFLLSANKQTLGVTAIKVAAGAVTNVTASLVTNGVQSVAAAVALTATAKQVVVRVRSQRARKVLESFVFLTKLT